MSHGALAYLRRQYLCVLRRCAFLNAFASWMLLAAPAAMAADIVPDGRTQTSLQQAGAVTDVSTATVRGKNAFNSFSRFNIGSGQTVNLHVPKRAANLLNVVRKERSVLNGVMNAYKDGRIGGNVYFFNPHGVVVGQQGQINVGSLHVAAPTPAYVERLVGPNGQIDNAAVAQALSGESAVEKRTDHGQGHGAGGAGGATRRGHGECRRRRAHRSGCGGTQRFRCAGQY